MKNKKIIVSVSIVLIVGLFMFALHLKKGKLYTFHNMDSMKIAMEDVFHTTVDLNSAVNYQTYNNDDVSYLVGTIDDYANHVGKFAVFQEENENEYRCIYHTQLSRGNGKVLVDEKNHVYICIGTLQEEFMISSTIQYTSGTENTNFLSGYNILLSIESDPDIQSITLGESEYGQDLNVSIQRIG